jgi:hypothetical protein
MRDVCRSQGVEMIRFWYKEPRYLYMIHCAETGLTKIGITDNPRRRIAEITGTCAFELELIALWTLPKNLARGFEMHIHEALSDFRHHGEWFKMDREDLVELASTQILSFAARQDRKAMKQFKPTLPQNAFHVGLL